MDRIGGKERVDGWERVGEWLQQYNFCINYFEDNSCQNVYSIVHANYVVK